jgi:thymidylate synthase ThyX
MRGDKLLSVDEIHRMLWEKIRPTLPSPQPNMAPTQKVDENPYVEKRDGRTRMTEAGKQFLTETTTSVDGNVYSFSDKMSPITVAAAMARLSRRADDMRLTILDEFAHAMGKDEKLLQRVITAYGDDSVQQLVGLHMVVENASNLLTKKLEWGRLAAYLEQSTRYIYFDELDEHGQYRYFVPPELDRAMTVKYKQALDEIFRRYSSIVHDLTKYVSDNSDVSKEERDAAWKGAVRAQACDAARGLLPVATKSTVGIFASGQALESLIMHLLSDELPEARTVGAQLLEEGRKIIPTFLERADKPERGGAMVAYRANTAAAVKQLAGEYLPNGYSDDSQAVTLTDIWPRNELDLVADMLYEHSDQSLEAIRAEVAGWNYDKKLTVFEAYMGERLNRRHKPGRALEKAHYSWDLVCDYGIFRDLQRHRMVDDMEWQLLTPRFGFEVPQLVEEAGLTEEYESCFAMSLELYSVLQANGYDIQAQYATLLGHKMRWKVTMNARETFHFNELRTSPQGHPGYRKLVLQMHDVLAQKHPLLCEAMKFVNQGEDDKLTRLAAERYTQFKLNQLG